MAEGVVAVTETRKATAESAAKRRRRMPVPIVMCCALLGIVVVMVVFGPLLTPHDPGAQNALAGSAGPSAEHWLGTDALGRDVFSRVIAGARSAILGPLLIAVATMVCGNLLGLLSGYRGGLADFVIMRWVDLMVAMPALLVIIVVAGALDGGYWMAVALLTVLSIPFDARVIRAAALEQNPRPYVEAAKTLGVADRRIMFFHIWPNIAATAFANTFLLFAGALIALSGLSFLGLGAEPGTPDWGQMLSENQALLFANPIASIAPGLAIVLAATATNLVGDWTFEKISSRGATR
ncbi:ABC transporter permease [Streptomyces sp. NPDC058001]|uniref:ABC transporter permease n=1 Tax=Streptomyces sp. NPDC058001 TaxID=3346300 RepID=UPI0036EA2982